jgi:flagellum-specific ATP synthase
MSYFVREKTLIEEATSVRITGRVSQVIGLVVECAGLAVPVGSLCAIYPSYGRGVIEAEVIGFRGDYALVMPLGEMQGIKRFDRVRCISTVQTVEVGDDLLGRVVDPRGFPIDSGPPITGSAR